MEKIIFASNYCTLVLRYSEAQRLICRTSFSRCITQAIFDTCVLQDRTAQTEQPSELFLSRAVWASRIPIFLCSCPSPFFIFIFFRMVEPKSLHGLTAPSLKLRECTVRALKIKDPLPREPEEQPPGILKPATVGRLLHHGLKILGCLPENNCNARL